MQNIRFLVLVVMAFFGVSIAQWDSASTRELINGAPQLVIPNFCTKTTCNILPAGWIQQTSPAPFKITTYYNTKTKETSPVVPDGTECQTTKFTC